MDVGWRRDALKYGMAMCRRSFLICYAQSEKLLYSGADEHVPRNEIIEIMLLSSVSIFCSDPSSDAQIGSVLTKYL